MAATPPLPHRLRPGYPAPSAGTPLVEELQLEVWINDRDTGLVAAVTRQADDRLSTTADALRAVGLSAPRRPGLIDLAVLPVLPGMAARPFAP